MSNNVGPVGIAVVGCGNISDQYLGNLVRFPDVAVLACADLDRDRAANQAAKYGVPHSGDLATVLAMPEVELVVNLTIPAVHASVALQAIRAGKHVYGEKPFALSVRDAQTVTAAATGRGVQLGNAPDTFLGAGLQTARRLIEEGRIGTPISAKTTFGYPGPDAWHPSPEFLFQQGAGPLLDMGPYYLTALVQMLGPVKTVSGFSSRAQGKRTIGSGPRAGEIFDVTVDTQVLALLEFASGPIATATFSFDAPTGFRELEVQGTEAVIRSPDPNYFDGSVFLCKKDVNKVEPREWFEVPAETDWVEIPADGSAEGRGMGVLDMARAMRSGGKPRANADLAIHVLDVMESIAAAAASRQTTPVATTCSTADLLPAGWNPLQRSV
jgi:predicted dehydrogenase